MSSRQKLEEAAQDLAAFQGYKQWPGWKAIENTEKAHNISNGLPETKEKIKDNLRQKRRKLEENHDISQRQGIYVCTEQRESSHGNWTAIKAWVKA